MHSNRLGFLMAVFAASLLPASHAAVPTRPATAPDPWHGIQPPPLSLSIKDLDLSRLVEELNKAMGMTAFVATPIPARGVVVAKSYTLEAKDLTLWQIVLKLWEQQPFNLLRSNPLRFTIRMFPPSPAAISGPFLLSLTTQTLTTTTSLLDPPSLSTTIGYTFDLFGDPRLKNVEITRFRIVEATDDAGNKWSPTAITSLVNPPVIAGINAWNRIGEIQAPAGPGKKLLSLKVEADITLDDLSAKKAQVTCQFVFKDLILP